MTMRTLALLSMTLALTAGAAEDPPSHRPLTPRETGIAPPTRIPPAIEPAPAGAPVNTSEIPKAVRRAVVADAAKRFNVAESAVVLTSAEQLTWSDGSLGCPEPGRYYTQNLVPGYVIVAKTSAGELTYHTDTRGQARSCGKGRPVGGVAPTADR